MATIGLDFTPSGNLNEQLNSLKQILALLEKIDQSEKSTTGNQQATNSLLQAQQKVQKRISEIEKERERAGLLAIKYLQQQEKERVKAEGKRISDARARERAEQKLANELTRYNQKLREQNSIVGQLKKQVEDWKRVQREATDPAQLRRASREIANLQSQYRQLTTVTQQKAKGSLFNSVFGGSLVGNVVGNITSRITGGIEETVKKAVELTASREAAIIKLTEAFRGNQTRAQDTVNLIEDFALKANFGIAELTEGSLRLANRGLRPTKELLTQISDIANALSTRSDGFTQVVEAVLDAEVGQFRRLEELGVAIDAKTLKSSNKIIATFKDQTKVIENSGAAIKAYVLGLSELDTIQGVTAKSAEGLAGKIEQSGDAIDNLLRAMGESKKGIIKSFFDAFSDGVQQITRDIRGLNKIEEIVNRLDLRSRLGNSSQARGQLELLTNSSFQSPDRQKVLDLAESIQAVLENEKRSVFQRINDINDLRQEIASNRTLNEIQKTILQELISEADRSLADQIKARFEDANKFKSPDASSLKPEKEKKEDLSYLRQRKELFGSLDKPLAENLNQRIGLTLRLIELEKFLQSQLALPEAQQNVVRIKELRQEIEQLKEAVKIDTRPIEQLFKEIEKRTINPANPAQGGGLGNLGDRANTLKNLKINQSPTQGPKSFANYFDLITGTFVNEFPKYEEQISQIFSFLEEKQNSLTQQRLERIDREVQRQNSAVDTQRELAAKGLKNTLAFEEERANRLEALRQREQERAERRARRYAALQLLLNTLGNVANNAQNGTPLRAGQIGGSLLASGIGFFESGGLVDSPTQTRTLGGKVVNGFAQGRSHKQGGILAEFEGGEGILSRKEINKLGGPQGFYNLKKDLAQLDYPATLEKTNLQLQNVVVNNDSNSSVVNELRTLKSDLEKAINNIKTTHITVDELGRVVETVVENQMKKIRIHERKRLGE